MKKSAIEFTKKNQSVTYLVFSLSSMELVGYFTIALKPLTVRGETVSNTVKRKLLRISELDEMSDTYTMSAFLIAQLGKNYTDGRNKEITGNEEKLLSFYRDNRFSQFDTRQTASDKDESHELIQLLRLI